MANASALSLQAMCLVSPARGPSGRQPVQVRSAGDRHSNPLHTCV